MSTFLLPTEPIVPIDRYLANGVGGSGIRRAHELGQAATIDLVTRSGVRGRGGGGFSTGQWAEVAAQIGRRRYLVCNGAEGEPGTAPRAWASAELDVLPCNSAGNARTILDTSISSSVTGRQRLPSVTWPNQPVITSRSLPKLIDIADGRAVYDESFWRKQPDRTYASDGEVDDDTRHGA
jgi:hypothetical protein